MGEVVRLVDTAPVSVTADEMREWARAWLDAGIDAPAGIRSVVILFEHADGSLSKVSQSTRLMDTARLVGVLTLAAMRCAAGELEPPP